MTKLKIVYGRDVLSRLADKFSFNHKAIEPFNN
jgi:hypothetical protein